MWFLARSGAARRAVSGLLLAALVGLAGGVVLTAWAGARRTDTAYSRLREAWRHPDLVVTTNEGATSFDPEVALRAPGVASAQAVDGFGLALLTEDGGLDQRLDTAILAPVSEEGYYQLNRPRLAEGRLPDPDARDEVMVPEALRDKGFPVGSEHDACVLDFSEVLAYPDPSILQGTATLDQQRAFVAEVCDRHELRVVGVTRLGPDEVVLRETSEGEFMESTPAFVASVTKPRTFNIVQVALEPGADVGRFVDAVVDDTDSESGVSVQSSALRNTVVERTVEPYVRALGLFALVTALAAVAVLGPAVVRWAGTADQDRGPLLAVGLRPGQLRLASAIRGAALGLLAATIAVAIAASVSGRFPIGIARRIEPDPGWRPDGLVLVVGFVALVLIAAALGAVAPSREAVRAPRPSRLAEGLQAVGMSVAPLAGIRTALTGSRREAGAARAAGGVAIAIATVVTALTYEAGLGRLLDTPERYGWTWDAVVDTADGGVPPELVAALDDDPMVTATSLGFRTSLLRDGAAVQTFAVDPRSGGPYPLILEGRAPEGTDEVALAGQTLDRLDAGIGDAVAFRGPEGQLLDLTVVGQTLLPLLSLGQDLSIAEGGLVDVELIADLGDDDPGMVLMDLAPGVTIGDLRTSLADAGVPPTVKVEGPTHTADLRGYQAVRRTPVLLAAILAVLGLGVLAHSVASTPRRRQRELAVLRCVGFTARELRSTIRWTALTVVVAALLVAVPIGVASGRTLWVAFADGIGLDESGVTPIAPIAVVLVATVGCAVALAVIPGRRAARVLPAAVLRSE